MSKTINKPLAAALGAAFLASAALPAMAATETNPFGNTPLDGGYDLVSKADAEGKCGEGKCGEGKCGEEKADQEGKCGEGKCGEKKADKEGKCGEGKCGEAK